MKERIKQLRNSLGLTQQKFADRLGLKRQTIAAYEIGNIEPSDSTQLLICKEFGVSEDWLRTGDGDPYIKRTRNQEIVSNLLEKQDSFIDIILLITETYQRMDAPSQVVLQNFSKELLRILKKKDGEV